MLQPEFAALVGFSPSTVTSVETGRRRATPEFAIAIAGKTGAMPEPILNHSSVALDSHGHTYSAASYLLFREARPDRLSEEDVESLIRPIKIALLAAADAGRLRILAPMLRSSVEHLARVIDGVQIAVEARLARETAIKRKFTFAEIRKNSALAAALGIKGSEDRNGDDIACEVHATDTESVQQPWFDGWYTAATPPKQTEPCQPVSATTVTPGGTSSAPAKGDGGQPVSPAKRPYDRFV